MTLLNLSLPHIIIMISNFFRLSASVQRLTPTILFRFSSGEGASPGAEITK